MINTNNMKAISIKQPWASLIVHGIKDVENRTWRCPKMYIGKRILIHASARQVCYYPFEVMEHDQEKDFWNKRVLTTKDLLYANQITSAIIGSVEIVDCVINHPSVWAEKTDDYTIGMNPRIHEDITGKKIIYNWVLAYPIIYEEPIENVKGKLSFWDYPGINEVKIECPECGSIEIAVKNHTTMFGPFHCCNKCGYMITESDWEVIEQ